jgi:hypothetical protein
MSRVYFIFAVTLTGVVSLSTHILILQNFQPRKVLLPAQWNEIIGYAIRFCTTVGAVLLFRLSREYWLRLKFFPRSLLFAFLLMALTENLLRGSLMAIAVGIPWDYQILSAIPGYLGLLLTALLIGGLAPLAEKTRSKILNYVLLALFITAVVIWAGKSARNFLAPLLAQIPPVNPSLVAQPPYEKKILMLAYLTFLEPALASFICFRLIKNSLRKFTPWAQGIVWGALIAVVHAGLYSILQIVYSEGNFFYRIFYHGQFLWEYFLLGWLTAHFEKRLPQNQRQPVC